MFVSPYALDSLNLVEERLYEKFWRRRWRGVLSTVSEEFPEVQVRAMDFSEVPLPLLEMVNIQALYKYPGQTPHLGDASSLGR